MGKLTPSKVTNTKAADKPYKLADGIDPADRRQAEAMAAADTCEAVAQEWYAKHSPRWVISHASKVLRRLKRDVFLWIGSKPIATLTAPDVLAVLRRIEGRGAVETAHRVHQHCGQVLRYAFADERAPQGDVTRDMRGAPTAWKSGTSGLYIGAGFTATVVNGYYSEAVVFPVVLGNSAANKLAESVTMNSPVLASPVSTQTSYSSRVAAIDLNYVAGAVINSPNFEGSYGLDQAAPLAFSGGGCTNEPVAIARVNAAGGGGTGAISSALLLYAGAGCTSNPTIAVGGAGTGGAVTVTGSVSGGAIQGINLSSGGSGYGNGAVMPITYTRPSNVTIVSPYISTGTFGLQSAVWPWLVHSAAAPTTAAVTIINDKLFAPPSSGYQTSANLQPSTNQYASQLYLSYLSGSGVSPVTVNQSACLT